MADTPAPHRPTITAAVLRNPWVRFLGLLILIFLLVWLLDIISEVLIPFVLALIMAYIFDPVVNWLEGQKVFGVRLNRGAAVGLLVGTFVAVLCLILFVAVPSAVIEAQRWLDEQELDKVSTFSKVKQFLPKPWQDGLEGWLRSAPKDRPKIISRLIGDLVSQKEAVDTVGRSLRAIALNTLTVLMWVFQFFLFFVVTIYLLLDIQKVRSRVADALPLRYKDEILRVAGRVDDNLKSYFRGQCIVVLVLTAIFTVGLGIVRCPMWYVIGIVGGIGAFIPYFALAVGMVPAIVLSAAVHGNVLYPVLAAAVFGVGLFVDNIYVTPKVIGKSVGIHPVMIILSILVFGTLFGFLGVLFAIPIAAVVKVFAQELFTRYKASPLYTGENSPQ